MAKIKKPAPKGGKKTAASKKVAKRAPKKLTERQADQFNADKMRADAFASTQSAWQTVEASKNFSANVSQLAAACFEGVDVKPKKKSIRFWTRYQSSESGRFISAVKALADKAKSFGRRVMRKGSQ